MKNYAAALISALTATVMGCSKMVDKTTYSSTNKQAQTPYVPVPDSELAPSNKAAGLASTTYCQPGADGAYPFDVKMIGGRTTDSANGTYVYGEGGGCLERPLREVWTAAMNQDLMVWTEKGNSGASALLTPPAGVTRAFDAEYTHVESGVGVKVKWNMTWFHTVVAGTPKQPERILINYRRYKGTKFIKYWEGSIILTKLSDTVTGIWVRNQINAARVTEVNARGACTDIIAKVRTGIPALDLLP